MLADDELSLSLQGAATLHEAQKLVLDLLEERYGRGAIALERPQAGIRPPQLTRLSKVTATMVEEGLYPRECVVISNEHFIVESELRELVDDDVALIESVTVRYRQALPQLLSAEGRDLLTGLPGAARFTDELTRLISSKRTLCLLMLDIDRFGEYNSIFGSSEGDRMVLEITDLLAEKTRSCDTVFRLLGDEFAVLLPATNVDDASRIAERVRDAFHTRFGDDNFPLTASLGLASWPDPATDKGGLLKGAKDAMYAAWRAGGDRVFVCPACT